MAVEPTLIISERFFSIQGESAYAGLPCVFLRLAGCNLRCRYCDTQYAWEARGDLFTIPELLAYLSRYPGMLVEITGGEPLLQDNVYTLMNQLLAGGRRVLLETNGSVSLDNVPADVVKIMDLKCPDSGMHEKMVWKNIGLLSSTDEIKFVLSSRRDYDWAVRKINDWSLVGKIPVSFSPVAAILPSQALASWMLADQMPVRLQLQLHKIIWPGAEQGR